MDIVIICFAAFLTAVLTFFSGFGLGTILAPVFAVFFPVELAIALTGVVHFANNLFKITLVGKNTDRAVLLRFGIPAIFAAFAGAWVLTRISDMPSLYKYTMWERSFEVTPVKLVVAILLIFFSLAELLPFFKKIQFGREKLVAGGLLSGFFGGLTGLQGAIRSAFLIKSGLGKESYIATGVAIACLIDISRLSVYASRFTRESFRENLGLIIAATLSAMAGALLGNKLLKKITLQFVQLLVALMLLALSLALGTGLI